MRMSIKQNIRFYTRLLANIWKIPQNCTLASPLVLHLSFVVLESHVSSNRIHIYLITFAGLVILDLCVSLLLLYSLHDYHLLYTFTNCFCLTISFIFSSCISTSSLSSIHSIFCYQTSHIYSNSISEK